MFIGKKCLEMHSLFLIFNICCYFTLIMCQEIPTFILMLLNLLAEVKHIHANLNPHNTGIGKTPNFGFLWTPAVYLHFLNYYIKDV